MTEWEGDIYKTCPKCRGVVEANYESEDDIDYDFSYECSSCHEQFDHDEFHGFEDVSNPLILDAIKKHGVFWKDYLK